MPDLDPLKEDFLLLAALNGHFQARKAALGFRRDHSAADEKDKLGRELFELRVQAEHAAAWMEKLWAGKAVLKASGGLPADQALALTYAESLVTELRAEAERCEAVEEKKPEALGRGHWLQLCATLHRLAGVDDNMQKAFFTAARQGLKHPDISALLAQPHEADLIFHALNHYAELLQGGKAWPTEEVKLLQLRCRSAPGRLRLHAAVLRQRARRHSGTDAASAYKVDAGIFAEFTDAGLNQDQAALWSSIGLSAEEAQAWASAGMDAAAAHGWGVQGLGPGEALTWLESSILPEEGACLIYAGFDSAAKAHAALRALGSADNVLAWAQAGLSLDESIALKAKGARSPEQALSIKKMLGAKDSSAASLADLAASAPEGSPKAWAEVPGAAQPDVPAGPRSPGDEVPAPAPSPEPPQKPADPSEAPAPSRLEPLGILSNDDLQLLRERAAKLLGHGTAAEPEELVQPLMPAPALLYWGWPITAEAYASSSPEPELVAPELWLKRLRAMGDQRSLRQVNAWLGQDGASSYLAASELAAHEKASTLHDLDPTRDWTESCSALAIALGLDAVTGQWRLSGAGDPAHKGEPLVFWGIAYDDPGKLPWLDAMDYDPRESWPARWSRRAEDLGFDDDVPACVLGTLPSTQGARYVVAVAASLKRGKPGLSIELGGFRIGPKWKDALEDFCAVMEVPLRGPRWYLAFADIGEGA